MRNLARFLVAATVLVPVGLPPAAAMTAVDSTGLRAAIETVNPVVSVLACWGYGWRGWGLHPGCLLRGIYPAAPAVYPAPVYARQLLQIRRPGGVGSTVAGARAEGSLSALRRHRGAAA